MKRLLLLITFSLTVFTVSAQLDYFTKRGDFLYKNMMYASAIPLFESALAIDSTQMDSKLKLADCYVKINDSKNAERLYESLYKSDTAHAEYILNYADALSENGKYKKAQKLYSQYELLPLNDNRGEKFKTAFKNINKLYSDSTKYKINYLSVNSHEPDFSPVAYGKGLIFCSGRNKSKISKQDDSPFLDLFYLEDTAQLIKYPVSKTIRYDNYTPKKYDESEKGKAIDAYNHLNADETEMTSNDTRTLVYRIAPKPQDTTNTDSQTPVIPFKKFDSKMHEGPFCFTRTKDTMFLTRNMPGKTDHTSNLGIYISIYKDSVWTEAKPFQYNNKKYSFGHPAITMDGKTLYFVSNQPGGQGGTDIWYSKWENNTWSTPVNAGNLINTKGNEMFPSVNNRGDLYFASNGHAGLGGLDIFKSIRSSNGNLGKPQNMGYPLNSMKDDFGLNMPDGKNGYFSSNRKNGDHDDDIYSVVVLRRDPLLLKGLVTEAGTNKKLGNALIFLKDAKDKVCTDTSVVAITANNGEFYADGRIDYNRQYSVIATADYHDSVSVDISTINSKEGDTVFVKIQLHRIDPVLIVSGTVMESDTKQPMANMKVTLFNIKTNKTTEYITKNDGKYLFSLDTNNRYTVTCAKLNCGTNIQKINTYKVKHSKAYTVDLYMVCKGDVIVLNDIFYDFDSTSIRSDASLELDNMVPLFFKYPDMTVELSSHADCRGGAEYNYKLTTARAKSAVNYLVSKNIDPSRLTLYWIW